MWVATKTEKDSFPNLKELPHFVFLCTDFCAFIEYFYCDP